MSKGIVAYIIIWCALLTASFWWAYSGPGQVSVPPTGATSPCVPQPLTKGAP